MDTTQQITMLCDADMRLRWGMLSRMSKWVTIAQLQCEYDCQRWLDASREAMEALGVKFQEAAEKMREVFIGSFEKVTVEIISELRNEIEGSRQSITVIFPKNHGRHVMQESLNNYRKPHHMPLIHRARCRWRPRESRRSLDGLSPQVVIVDELHEL